MRHAPCMASGRSGVVLPFALDTSPWDAVTLRVLEIRAIGGMCLSALPSSCLPNDLARLRALFSTRLSTSAGRRLIWISVGMSICGTTLVEAHSCCICWNQRMARLSSDPRLRHRNRQRYHSVDAPPLHFPLGPACRSRHRLSRHAALCLVVYNGAPGTGGQDRAGWYRSCFFGRSFSSLSGSLSKFPTQPPQTHPRAA